MWRAPFILIAILTVLFILVGARILPTCAITSAARSGPIRSRRCSRCCASVNHLRALLFSALLIFSGFTVIPYITVYAVGNVGIPQHDIPFIYLCGRCGNAVHRAA